MTPKSSLVGVLLSVAGATGVSFFVASLLLKAQRTEDEEGDGDALTKATSQMKDMKAASKGMVAEKQNNRIDMANVKSIIVACDAGMGSSAMGAGLLRKKVQDAGLDIKVTNVAINNLPQDVDIVITHSDLTDRARKHAEHAHHISLKNFLDGEVYSSLVAQLLAAQGPKAANDPEYIKKPLLAANDESLEPKPTPVFQLDRKNVHLGLQAGNKQDAIRYAGEQLVALGYVEPEYVDAMFEREKLVSTYLGESIAVPHGTIEAKDKVKKTGIVICQYPAGVQFTEDDDDVAKLVIGIAAKNDEHIQVITAITNALDDPDAIDRLASTGSIDEVLEILSATEAA